MAAACSATNHTSAAAAAAAAAEAALNCASCGDLSECWNLGIAGTAITGAALVGAATAHPLAVVAVGAAAAALAAASVRRRGEVSPRVGEEVIAVPTDDEGSASSGAGGGGGLCAAPPGCAAAPAVVCAMDLPSASVGPKRKGRETPSSQPPPPPLGTVLVKDCSFPSPLTARGFFELFFSDGSSHLPDFHRSRDDRDVNFGPWEPADGGGDEGLKRRVCAFQKRNRAVVGPDYAPTTKTQRLLRPLSRHLFAMESRTDIEGVPYSDRFHGVERWVARSGEGGGGVRLTVSYEVVFTSSCMFQSKIRSNSVAGVTDFVTKWCERAGETVRQMKERGEMDKLDPHGEEAEDGAAESGVEVDLESNLDRPSNMRKRIITAETAMTSSLTMEGEGMMVRAASGDDGDETISKGKRKGYSPKRAIRSFERKLARARIKVASTFD